MSSNKDIKIRELVSKHPEEDDVVCLEDLIKSLISLQVPLGKLEMFNYKDSIVEATKGIIDHEKLVVLFKHKLKHEVRPEVVAYHKENKKPRKMHPNSLDNVRKKK